MNGYKDQDKNRKNKITCVCVQFKSKIFKKKIASIVPIEYKMMEPVKNKGNFRFYIIYVYT